MQGRGSLEVKLPNTDWCNIAGKASDMHVEGSLDVKNGGQKYEDQAQP